MSVNRKPLFISLSTDAYSINIHTRKQQARVFYTYMATCRRWYKLTQAYYTEALELLPAILDTITTTKKSELLDRKTTATRRNI